MLRAQNLVDVSRSTQRFDKNACKRYKDFARMAKDTSETRRTNDFEISQAVHTIVDIDPLTKQPLSNPVRNKICKHIYGKDSVVQALQKNPRLRYVINDLPTIQCDVSNRCVYLIDVR